MLLFLSVLFWRDYNSYGTYVAQLDDNIIIVEGKVARTGATGKDIYKWNFNANEPQIVGKMSEKKLYGFSVKITSRWFPQCTGKYTLLK